MNITKKILRFCSLVLIFTGSNLFVRHKPLAILRILFRTWFAVFAAYNFKYLAQMWMGKGFSLTFLATLMFHLVRITFFILIILRRKRIESFVVRCLNCIHKPNLSKIWKKILIINFLIFSLKLFDFATFRIPKYSMKNGLFALLTRMIHDLTVSCFSETCGLYSIMLFILSARIHATINSIERRFKEGEGVVSHYISSIHSDVQTFDSLFSFLPFCWFGNGVVETPRTILALIQYMSNFQRSVNVIVWVINLTISPLLICLQISYVKNNINDAVDSVYHKVVTSNQMPGQKILIRFELETLKDINFTGLSFFTIDRSLILSLIGAVCTVSVLIATYASTV